jgi:hypothetical protein
MVFRFVVFGFVLYIAVKFDGFSGLLDLPIFTSVRQLVEKFVNVIGIKALPWMLVAGCKKLGDPSQVV